MRWTEYAVALLLFSASRCWCSMSCSALQALLPLNPQGLPAVPRRPRLQHRRVVHDQHELAGVQRRIDHELLHADGRARVPQLRVGRSRASPSRSPSFAASRAEGAGHDRQLLGRHGPRARCGSCCRSASSARSLLVSQGVVQNSGRTTRVQTVEGSETQVIAQGPVASQEIIKQFGTNGGGFFNANSAHPFENPTPLSNFLAMFGIFAISSGLTYTLGRMTGSRAPRMGGVGRDGVPVPGRRDGGVLGRGRGNPLLTQRRRSDVRRSPGRQHGRQGGSIRHRQHCALRHHHHRRQLRRGQRLARFVHAARRSGAARQHHA